MSEDRRQVDRRQADRQNPHEKKTLTVSLTAFVVFVAIIAIVFVLAASFLAVYYEKRIREIIQIYYEATPQELIYTSPLDDEEIEYFDVENIVTDPNVSTNLITDANVVEDTTVDENTSNSTEEGTVDENSVDANATAE